MSTATTITISDASRADATKFLYGVRDRYPHLLPLGYQKIIDGTTEGMKSLNIFSDNISEPTFWAGLHEAMRVGTLPPVPATVSVQQPQPTAEEVAAQEALRNEREQDEARSRRIAMQNDPRRHATESHNPVVKEAATAAEQIRKAMVKAKESLAQSEAENITVFRADGRPDRAATEQLKEIIVRENGEVSWQRTVLLRKEAAKNIEHQSRIKRDLR